MTARLFTLGTVIWSLWIVQAIVSAWRVWRLERRLRRSGKPDYDVYRPTATVIVPVKGLDLRLKETVRALCHQDYPYYRLLFVVESKDDPAYSALKNLLAGHNTPPADVLLAGIAPPTTGQKIHNQLAALRHLEPTADDDEVWVFADSDFVPDAGWLGRLIWPLRHARRTGMTTSYRWLIPVGSNASLWTHLASVMNSSVACLHRMERLETAWGGAMALRVATARKGRLFDWLTGALTDDLQFTRMCHAMGLRVRFVAECLVRTPVELDLRGLIEFARRQYLLARIYLPALYWLGFCITGTYLAGWISAWLALVLGGYIGAEPRWLVAPLVAMSAVAVANHLRVGFRRRLVTTVFGAETAAALKTTLQWERWTTPLWMTLHFLLIVAAGFGRTLRWRTVVYRIDGPHRVLRLIRRPEPSPSKTDAFARTESHRRAA